MSRSKHEREPCFSQVKVETTGWEPGKFPSLMLSIPDSVVSRSKNEWEPCFSQVKVEITGWKPGKFPSLMLSIPDSVVSRSKHEWEPCFSQVKVETTGWEPGKFPSLMLSIPDTECGVQVKSQHLFTELLNLDVPTMIISPDASMYISWSMVGAGQSFTATWEKVAGKIIDIKF